MITKWWLLLRAPTSEQFPNIVDYEVNMESIVQEVVSPEDLKVNTVSVWAFCCHWQHITEIIQVNYISGSAYMYLGKQVKACEPHRHSHDVALCFDSDYE